MHLILFFFIQESLAAQILSISLDHVTFYLVIEVILIAWHIMEEVISFHIVGDVEVLHDIDIVLRILEFLGSIENAIVREESGHVKEVDILLLLFLVVVSVDVFKPVETRVRNFKDRVILMFHDLFDQSGININLPGKVSGLLDEFVLI